MIKARSKRNNIPNKNITMLANRKPIPISNLYDVMVNTLIIFDHIHFYKSSSEGITRKIIKLCK